MEWLLLIVALIIGLGFVGARRGGFRFGMGGDEDDDRVAESSRRIDQPSEAMDLVPPDARDDAADGDAGGGDGGGGGDDGGDGGDGGGGSDD